MRVVITGANRGIGFELARQLAARRDEVIAAVREPKKTRGLFEHNVTVAKCDVADEKSVAAFAKAMTDPVDVLINNAGVSGDKAAFERIDLEDCLRTYQVNALGALAVSRALLPQLRRGRGKKIAHITSKMGSIGDNSSGGWFAYRMSKAALNMASKCMALELAPEGITSIVLHPGWVQTDMGGPGAPLPVAESAAGLIEVIDRLGPKESGRFFDFRGAEIPW